MLSFRMILSCPNGNSDEGYSNDSSLFAAERRNVYRKGAKQNASLQRSEIRLLTTEHFAPTALSSDLGPGFSKHLVPPGPQTKNSDRIVPDQELQNT